MEEDPSRRRSVKRQGARRRAAVALLLLMPAISCMSVFSRVDHGFRLYSGVRVDAQGWYQSGTSFVWRLFLLADLPFSLVADTALLPVDLYVVLTELTPEERWERFGDEQAEVWNAMPFARRKEIFEAAHTSEEALQSEPRLNGIHVDPQTYTAISTVRWERGDSLDKRQ